jgi:hypothetical protein
MHALGEDCATKVSHVVTYVPTRKVKYDLM